VEKPTLDASLPGTMVTMSGSAVDDQAILINEGFEPFEKRTCINVEY